MLTKHIFVVTLLAGCCLLPTVSPCQNGGSSFFDRFSRLNSNRWTISDGWSNGDYTDCAWSKRNVRIPDGGLQLELKSQKLLNKKYSCAEIQSNNVYGFGTYEVRMRSAGGPGIVSAFFNYAGPPTADKPYNEIDLEILGRYDDRVQTNYFIDGKSIDAKLNATAFNPSQTTNDYAFQWLPDALRWYVNGTLVREVVRKSGEPFPTHPGKIIMMLWNSTSLSDWLGPFDKSTLPQSATFEWVAFTKAGQECQFPESLVCRLKK
jgi:endo-1,3-1,4-beta-glycanase ExoK